MKLPIVVIAFFSVVSAASAQTPAPPAAAPAVAPAVAAPAAPVDRTAELARIRSERNLKVCRDTSDGLSFLSGIVQGRERGKIQVRVTEQIEKASGKSQTDFHATNVWDDPVNWRICP